jgi:hypothetical protein
VQPFFYFPPFFKLLKLAGSRFAAAAVKGAIDKAFHRQHLLLLAVDCSEFIINSSSRIQL